MCRANSEMLLPDWLDRHKHFLFARPFLSEKGISSVHHVSLLTIASLLLLANRTTEVFSIHSFAPVFFLDALVHRE